MPWALCLADKVDNISPVRPVLKNNLSCMRGAGRVQAIGDAGVHAPLSIYEKTPGRRLPFRVHFRSCAHGET